MLLKLRNLRETHLLLSCDSYFPTSLLLRGIKLTFGRCDVYSGKVGYPRFHFINFLILGKLYKDMNCMIPAMSIQDIAL